jgi:hypothetical protein
MTNPRKNKEKFSLWLKEEEARMIISFLEANMPASIGLILIEANKRGDFEKR